jgi:hypothetical protein
METMNYDPDIRNKEHQLQGNRDPGTVLTLPHLRRLLKYSRPLTNVISSLRASKRGGLSGLKDNLGSIL